MSRLTAVILALLVICALALVTSQHRARKLFIELESQQSLAKKLDDEHAQLKIEQGVWGAPRRVGELATRSLGMRMPAPTSTVLIQSPEALVAKSPKATPRHSTAASAAANTSVVAVRP